MAEVKRGSSSGIRLWWSLQGLRFTQGTALSADIAGMDALSLNYWLSTFVMEVTKSPVKDTLKHYLGEKNGSETLNPLDASDKRKLTKLTFRPHCSEV